MVAVVSSVAVLAALIGTVIYLLVPSGEEQEYQDGYTVQTTEYPSDVVSPAPGE